MLHAWILQLHPLHSILASHKIAVPIPNIPFLYFFSFCYKTAFVSSEFKIYMTFFLSVSIYKKFISCTMKLSQNKNSKVKWKRYFHPTPLQKKKSTAFIPNHNKNCLVIYRCLKTTDNWLHKRSCCQGCIWMPIFVSCPISEK